jgi:hypothetical protein
VPVPFAKVFHPENVYPVRVSVPAPEIVYAVPPVVYEPDVGAVPPVFPFPLYVIVYVTPVHCAYSVTFEAGIVKVTEPVAA